MSAPFYGREKELNLLKECLEKKVASLIVIKGRRRIGKSRLAEEFCRPMRSLFFEGLPPKNDETTGQHQREHFAKSLEQELGIGGLKADDWDDLFRHLAQATQKGRVVLVFDEIKQTF